jgi:hypothetical protein
MRTDGQTVEEGVLITIFQGTLQLEFQKPQSLKLQFEISSKTASANMYKKFNF